MNEILINLLPVFPGVILIFAGLVLMLHSAFCKDSSATNTYAIVCIVLAAAVEFLILTCECSTFSAGFSVGDYAILASDSLTSFFRFIFLIAVFFSIFNLCFDKEFQDKKSPVLIILFFASVGGYFLISSREVISWYLSLELMSLSAYVLVASQLGSKFSAEAALKYFVAGALGSALILFGMACFYGLSGSGSFAEFASAIAAADNKLALLASVMLLAGLAFKLGLVPFHYWVADVYQGAAASITVYLSSAFKVAVVAATFFVCKDVLLPLQAELLKFWWILLALSALLANFLALKQISLSRLFAYSAIAHTAYLSIGFLHPDLADFQVALLNYLVIYLLMTIISFVSIVVLNDDKRSALLGLSKRSPFLTGVILINLLAMAGLPPLLSGLFAKVYILKAALSMSYIGLAIIFITGFVVACYYYLKLIALMFTESENTETLAIGTPAKLSLFLLSATLIYYTVFPMRLYDFLSRLISF